LVFGLVSFKTSVQKLFSRMARKKDQTVVAKAEKKQATEEVETVQDKTNGVKNSPKDEVKQKKTQKNNANKESTKPEKVETKPEKVETKPENPAENGQEEKSKKKSRKKKKSEKENAEAPKDDKIEAAPKAESPKTQKRKSEGEKGTPEKKQKVSEEKNSVIIISKDQLTLQEVNDLFPSYTTLDVRFTKRKKDNYNLSFADFETAEIVQDILKKAPRKIGDKEVEIELARPRQPQKAKA